MFMRRLDHFINFRYYLFDLIWNTRLNRPIIFQTFASQHYKLPTESAAHMRSRCGGGLKKLLGVLFYGPVVYKNDLTCYQFIWNKQVTTNAAGWQYDNANIVVALSAAKQEHQALNPEG